MCDNPTQQTHAEYERQAVFQGPEACLQEAKSGQAGAFFIFASLICASSDAQKALTDCKTRPLDQVEETMANYDSRSQ